MYSRKMRAIAYGLSAVMLVGACGLEANANPLAGITSILSASTQDAKPKGETTKSENTSTLSGVTQMMNDMLVTSSNQTAEVKAEDAGKEVIQTAAKADYSDVAIAQVDNFVYIRDIPSEEGEVLGKLYNNSAAAILAVEGDWYKVTSGSVTGYVKSEFVVMDEELAKKVSRRLATVTTTTLYVREEPSTEASVLGMVPEGDDLTVLSEDEIENGWVKVDIEEGEGYVSTEFVELSTDYVLAESKAEEEARLAKEEAERKAAAAAAAKKTGSKSRGGSSGGRAYAAPSGAGGGSVASYACQFVGNPYVYGGTSLTNGADCSGFVMSVYAAFGVGLPHSSSALRSVGYGVSVDAMQPGDIVCYSGHVAIYIGGGQIVHASTAATGIKISSAYYKPIICARRIF